MLQPIDQLTTEKTVQTLSDISHAEENKNYTSRYIQEEHVL